jgi:hypothetical protein
MLFQLGQEPWDNRMQVRVTRDGVCQLKKGLNSLVWNGTEHTHFWLIHFCSPVTDIMPVHFILNVKTRLDT